MYLSTDRMSVLEKTFIYRQIVCYLSTSFCIYLHLSIDAYVTIDWLFVFSKRMASSVDRYIIICRPILCFPMELLTDALASFDWQNANPWYFDGR